VSKTKLTTDEPTEGTTKPATSESSKQLKVFPTTKTSTKSSASKNPADGLLPSVGHSEGAYQEVPLVVYDSRKAFIRFS
jgi:hypothetical protein